MIAIGSITGPAVAGAGGPQSPALVLSARALDRIQRGKRNQSELAREMGLNRSHVCLIFAGKRKPSLDVAARLAGRLRVSLDEFYAYLVQAPAPVVN
jgi:transcriptional regulator with XRE-family HTH domain